MNISAKLQLLAYSLLMASEEFIYLFFSRKFSISVAMATNQSQRFRHNLYVW